MAAVESHVSSGLQDQGHSPRGAQKPAVGLLASPPAAAQAEGFHLSRLDGRILPPPLCFCSQRKTLAGPLILLLPWDGWLPAACSLFSACLLFRLMIYIFKIDLFTFLIF